jgi:hypothetical protein
VLMRRCPPMVAAVLLTSLVTGCPILQQANPSKAQEPADSPVVTPSEQPTAPQPSPQKPAASSQPYGPVPIELPLLTQPQLPGQPQAPAQRPPYPVINEQYQLSFNVEGQQLFAQGELPNTAVDFNERDLYSVLYNVRRYFATSAQADPNILREGVLGTQGVTVADTLKTLDFMLVVLYEDLANQRPTRLKDPNFINTHFKVIKWKPYNPNSPQQNQLRITKYAVFRHQGSRTPTAQFNTPLYRLEDQFAGDKFYTKYTKQQVLSGIYSAGQLEAGKAKPIAYLTREGLEDALLQGTVLIKFPDGGSAFFNVDRNNGMPYAKGIQPRSQKRYWYFKEVESIKGYGGNQIEKIPVKPGVTFAGDVLNIGLGKIIVIEQGQGDKKQLRLGAIADTGGAFSPNLYQLDFLAGIFQNKAEFKGYIDKTSDYAGAYILVKR